MSLRRLLAPFVAVLLATATPALASTVVSSSPAPAAAAGTTSLITLEHSGAVRSYRLFVPTALPAGPRPLVLSMHGLTADAVWMESATGLEKTAVKGGVLLAYPDGLGNSWNAGTCCGTSSAAKVDDVGFLDAVVADVAARYAVDRKRIGVDGFSNGGMMAYRYACERSELVSTLVVVGGAYVAPACPFTKPLSLLHIHGLADTVVPFNGGTVSSTGTKVRPVLGPSGAIAQLDGCTGFSPSPFPSSSLVTQTMGTGCPPGVAVTVLASSTLKHVWPLGTTYGLDTPTMLWGFFANAWAPVGPPVQL